MSAELYPLATRQQIESTPSRQDGIPDDLEDDLRTYGCKLIHQAGILLKQLVHNFVTIPYTYWGLESRLPLPQPRSSSRGSGT
jgi:hypothetical protein